jgi:myo-inositol-1(or 4)-monophosphatase
MQPITNSLITAARKATKFLQRDFLELEMLQRSSKGNDDFCTKSYSKVKELLCNDLQKHANLLVFSDDQYLLNAAHKSVILVNPIDSLSNFARSIPFFALSITYLSMIENNLTAICSIMNFPVLNEIYYVEKGRGIWADSNNINKGRLRVSGISYLDKSLVAIDNWDIDSISGRNIRVFGSHCYAMQMFAAGKVDAVYFLSLSDILRAGFDLIVKESGGVVISNDEQKFVATNYELAEKFRSVISKK